MKRITYGRMLSGLLLGGTLAVGCTNGTQSTSTPAPDTAQRPQQPLQPPVQDSASLSQISLVVDTSSRELLVVKGSDTIKKYPVAVGTKKYPTPVGDFKISRIDFNPDWTPPEGDWAKNKKPEKPGSPQNPMGRARIVYQMPYTIHGTKDINSLGEADSHGSIRMANNHVIELAKLIMKESGTEKPESWYGQVLADSTKMVQVDLTTEIPLTNRD